MRVVIGTLLYDHGLISQVTGVLHEAVRNGFRIPPAEAGEAVRFLEEFMDRYHHGKEEMFIFPYALGAVPQLGATIGDLLEEHRRAREIIRDMKAALGAGDSGKFGDLCVAIAGHMAHHIKDEEDDVFPRIEARLPPPEDRRLHREAEGYLITNFGQGFYRASEESAKRLQDRVLGPGYFEKLAGAKA